MTVILLTGASGMVGGELAAKLLDAGHEVHALVHRQATILRNDGTPLRPRAGRLRLLQGDVSQPSLGLGASDHQALAERVDLVVHSAAVTEFGLETGVYQQVNVEGARQILRFCETSRAQPAPLLHVSTAYVCGERRGVVLENDLTDAFGFANPYERSKFEAELLVAAAQVRGLPVAIARPSIVVGDARTGAVRDFKNIYGVMRLGAEGRVRTIPGNFDATMDLVPMNYCVEALAGLVERFPQAVGRRFHLVRGRAVTLRDFSDVFAEYPPFEVPRFVPPEAFSPHELPPQEARYFRRGVALYQSYFQRSLRFDDSNTQALLGDRLPSIPAPKAQLRVLLNYALRVGYLGNPAAVRVRKVA